MASRADSGAGLIARRASQLIGSWLTELEQSDRGLLRVCGRLRLEQVLQRYLSQQPDTAREEVLAVCSREELETAARLLSERALAAPISGAGDEEVRAAVLEFAKRLSEAAASKVQGEGAAAATPSGRPTEILWHATTALQGARSHAAVTRLLVEAAAALCEARGAVWWERGEGREYTAFAFTGFPLGDRVVQFLPSPNFWTPRVTPASPVTNLSPDLPEHAELLSKVGAESGVILRLRDGRRWSAALSVHEGRVDEERLDLLVSLGQQGSAALRSLEHERAWERAAEAERQSSSDVEYALTSAVSQEELLDRVTTLAREETGADAALVLLIDEQDRVRWCAKSGISEREAGELRGELEEVTTRLRSERPGEPVGWEGRRLSEAGLSEVRKAGYEAGLGVGLPGREHALGALLLLARREGAFGMRERRLLEALAPRAAAAIENMQLFESAQRRLTEMSDLTWVSGRIASTLDLDTIAQTVSRAVANVLGSPRVAIFLMDEEEEEFRPLAKGQIGFPGEKTQPLPAQGHLGAEALATQSPRAVMDVERERRNDDLLVQWLGARALLCAPMIAPQGLRGLLVVADDAPRVFDLHMVTLVSTYANQAALAFQSAALYQHARQHVRRLSKLGEVAEALASAREASETAELVLKSAVELFEAPVGMMWLVDQEGGDLVLNATHGLRPGEWTMERLKPGEGLVGLAAQSRRPLVSMDVTRDGRFLNRRQARQQGLGAAIAAPLISRGRTVGVLNLYRRSSARFSEEDQRLLMSMASTAAVAVENTRLSREAQRRSEFVAGMMSEVNHRMRNSLQSVAGLLRMELERPQARSTQEVVRRAVGHVQAVAAVHEVIRDEDFAFVDMKEAAMRVVRVTHQARREQAADLQVTGARVMLPSQKAVSVALVINELVDNALRHGVAGRKDGRITISFAEGGGEVALQVWDNGPGLPAESRIDDFPGLGLKIVRGLIEQELGGKVEFESKRGFTVRARFPKLD